VLITKAIKSATETKWIAIGNDTEIHYHYDDLIVHNVGRGGAPSKTMNSMNFQRTAVGASESSPQWENATSPDQSASLTALLPAVAKPGATGKQRLMVMAVVAAVQVGLVAGLVYGMAREPLPVVVAPLQVSLLPEIEDVKPPPPPMRPPLVTPTIVMNLPQSPEIYEPPPLITVQAAAPSPITTSAKPVSSDPNAAIQTFQMKLLRHVNKNLRYPTSARQKREEGVVLVRFTMDRQGNISNVSVEKRCHFQALNDEGAAVLVRAQPFPPPPPELEGDAIQMVLPVKFSLR
jgi:protein TonB